MFIHTNIRTAHRTTNKLLHHLTPNMQTLDPITRSGVYGLSCPDCGKAYIGQTDNYFKTRYNEHKRAFRHNNETSKYALHAKTRHALGNIQDA